MHLREEVRKLAHEVPELRRHLLPLLKQAAVRAVVEIDADIAALLKFDPNFPRGWWKDDMEGMRKLKAEAKSGQVSKKTLQAAVNDLMRVLDTDDAEGDRYLQKFQGPFDAIRKKYDFR